MDRLGCFFMTARTLGDLEARVLKAEELGYEACGFPHIAGRDAMATLAAIGPKTSRIRLATGIVPIYTRTPVTMAQEAGLINEATNGRFMLGIGTGHKALVESWHGTPFHKPVSAMRDYLTILRAAIRDSQVGYTGDIFSASFGFLGFQPQPDMKILVGALGPRMIRLAGELADGVVLWMSTPDHVRDVVLPNLRAGAQAAGRDVNDLEIFACLFAAPGPDRASARDAIRRQLFAYLQLPSYRNTIAASGHEADLAAFDEGIALQDLPRALAGLSDALIDRLAATGGPEEVAATVDAFVRAGCTVPGVGVVGGYEGYENAARSLSLCMEAGSRVT